MLSGSAHAAIQFVIREQNELFRCVFVLQCVFLAHFRGVIMRTEINPTTALHADLFSIILWTVHQYMLCIPDYCLGGIRLRIRWLGRQAAADTGRHHHVTA